VRGKHRKPSRTRRVLLGALAATAASGIIVLLSATFADVAALGATGGSGAGIESAPLCLNRPAEPGHSYPLETNGLTPGVIVSNTGTGTETLTLFASAQEWDLPGRPVPLSWLSATPVILPAGHTATVPVTVSVPANARPGTYVAGLTASAGTGSGGAQFGASAKMLMAFTVGVTRPSWTRAQLAAAGNCWIPLPKLTLWQASSGTSYPDPPPGWQLVNGRTFVYTPPPGWAYTWADRTHPRQVWTGGPGPVFQCANPSRYPAPGGGDEIGGATMPVTGTEPGCARWLAEWQTGTLPAEPQLDNTLPGQATAVVTHPRAPAIVVTTTADRARAGMGAGPDGWVFVILMVLVAFLVVRWFLRRRGRPGR
jgi:hypothetical protein